MNLIKFNRFPFYPGWLTETEETLFDTKRYGNIPAVNIREENNQFIIDVAAPGYKKEDFKISLEKNMLTISSEKKNESEEKEGNYSRKEFSFNSFTRSFRISDDIRFDEIKANYEDGILKISLPVKEEVKLSREIKVA
jgi:HSP20 family protein